MKLWKCPADKLVFLIGRIRIRITDAYAWKDNESMFFSPWVSICNLHTVVASEHRDLLCHNYTLTRKGLVAKGRSFFLSKPSPALINVGWSDAKTRKCDGKILKPACSNTLLLQYQRHKSNNGILHRRATVFILEKPLALCVFKMFWCPLLLSKFTQSIFLSSREDQMTSTFL